MSTWNSIDIHNPGTLTVDTLPDALGEDGEMWESYDAADWRDEKNPRDLITVSGRSKYTAEEVQAALPALAIDGRRIVHSQEWDDDEVGQSEDIYENGAHAPEQGKHSALVPDTLPALVERLTSALAAYDAIESDDDPGYHARVDAAINALTPARDLLAALAATR